MRDRPLSILILALALSVLIPNMAAAGRNASGAILVHTDDGVAYTNSGDYCDEPYVPESCVTAVTRTDKQWDPSVIWFLVNFPSQAVPGVAEIHFGVRHNLPPGQGYVQDWRLCGTGAVEYPDAGFPDTPGGNVIVFDPPILWDTWYPIYWFAAWWGEGDNYFGSDIHPAEGEAKFVDDSVPPVADRITFFGEVRWFEEGSNDCVPPDPIGACCFFEGFCMELWEYECEGMEGVFQGVGVDCEPYPCPSTEACCLDDVNCVDVWPEECASMGGIAMGEGSYCDPFAPCLASAAPEESAIPERLRLTAIPNPTSGPAVFEYSLPEASTVTVEIYDAGGALVWRSSEGSRPAGRHSLAWEPRNGRGADLPSGIYLARIVTSIGSTTHRIVLTH